VENFNEISHEENKECHKYFDSFNFFHVLLCRSIAPEKLPKNSKPMKSLYYLTLVSLYDLGSFYRKVIYAPAFKTQKMLDHGNNFSRKALKQD